MASQELAAPQATNNHFAEAHEAATAEQRATGATALSHVHGLHSMRPRDNFPLPRELRDQIYGYLLDSKYTRVKRDNVGDRAYKYHLSVLGVNREIHDEAAEYLYNYKNNAFMVVRHPPAHWDSALMPPWIPLVAELGNRPMRYHSLEVTFVPNSHSPHSVTRMGAWLLLANDIDMYFSEITRYIHRKMAHCEAQTPMLVLCQNGSLIDRHVDKDGSVLLPHFLGVEFGSHRFHKATTEFQSSIISRLRSVSTPGLVVEVCGSMIKTPSLGESSSSPDSSPISSLVCSPALVWRMFLDFDSLKTLTDTLAQNGEIQLALDTLEDISCTMLIRFGCRMQGLPQDMRGPFLQLSVDTALTLAYLRLTVEDSFGSSGKLETLDLLDNTNRNQVPRLEASYSFHVRLLLPVTSQSYLGYPPGMTIANCIAELTLPGSNSHQLHDAAILDKLPDHNKLFIPQDLPAASCSVFTLPPNCINLRKVSLGDNIVGYLDTNMLRETSNEMREKINKLQVERGWQVTRFEDYD